MNLPGTPNKTVVAQADCRSHLFRADKEVAEVTETLKILDDDCLTNPVRARMIVALSTQSSRGLYRV